MPKPDVPRDDEEVEVPKAAMSDPFLGRRGRGAERSLPIQRVSASEVAPPFPDAFAPTQSFQSASPGSPQTK